MHYIPFNVHDIKASFLKVNSISHILSALETTICIGTLVCIVPQTVFSSEREKIN